MVGLIPDLMALSGVALVVEGSRRIYLPAAFIVAGIGLVGVALLAARRGV